MYIESARTAVLTLLSILLIRAWRLWPSACPSRCGRHTWARTEVRAPCRLSGTSTTREECFPSGPGGSQSYLSLSWKVQYVETQVLHRVNSVLFCPIFLCLVLYCLVKSRFLHNWIVLPCIVLFCSQPSLRYEKRCTAIHLLSITRWWGDCGVCDNCTSNIYVIQIYSTVDLQNCDKLTCTVRSAVNTQHTDRTVQVNLSQFCRSSVL